MKRWRLASSVSVLTLASFCANAADVYTFDSLSRVDFATRAPTIVGVLRNAASPTTVTFPRSANWDGYRSSLGFCMPMLLMMMEKPGRYLLEITYDPTNSSIGENLSCALELKN